nr:ribosomal protein L34 [Aphanocladia delicatula]WGH14269.1 ribosomal protein L34 [Aphanocladia delicatula]
MKTCTKLKKKRKHGFLIRMRTKNGQRIVNLKRRKGKKRLIR